ETMSAVIDSGHAHDEHAHSPYGGIMRWITTTNHKDIGTLYLWFAFTMFLVGGMLALGIRAELFQPGLQFWHPEFFNQLTSMHGLIMVFGAIMPAFVGFANWQVPMMIGAPDMAFARLNNWSFWMLPVAATLLVGSFFVPGGASAAGWTIYAPLSTQMGPGMDLAIFALHIMGASSIMGSINIITTILNMRAPGMTLIPIGTTGASGCFRWLRPCSSDRSSCPGAPALPAGPSTRRSRPRWDRGWTSRSSRSTSWAPPRSWARSTSSPRSSTCAHRG